MADQIPYLGAPAADGGGLRAIARAVVRVNFCVRVHCRGAAAAKRHACNKIAVLLTPKRVCTLTLYLSGLNTAVK